MNKLLTLEFRKTKRTFLYILLPAAFLAPLILVIVEYVSSQNVTFFDIIAKNSVFIQMISFASVVISGCYIITREYKCNMMPYLLITPNSMTRILLCKIIVLFLETFVLQLAIFGALILANTVISGFSGEIAVRLFTAGLLSTLLLSCIIPAVTFIALWRRSFAGSSIIFLVLLMLSFPFAFMSFGCLFPQMLPIILISEFFGYKRYTQISYEAGSLTLAATSAVFLYLSIIWTRKKG